MIGFQQVYKRALFSPLPPEGEEIDIEQCIERVLAVDLFAKVVSPLVDASLKDGYAAYIANIAVDDRKNPVFLELKGRDPPAWLVKEMPTTKCRRDHLE
jgi:molybdopterin biosynthesis enzyme